MAIGSRSQAAKTYLEKKFDGFPECSLKDLCLHGIRAIKETCPNDTELNSKNCVLAYVGKDANFTFVEGEKLEEYLNQVEAEEGGAPPAIVEDTGGEAEAAEPMDTETAPGEDNTEMES